MDIFEINRKELKDELDSFINLEACSSSTSMRSASLTLKSIFKSLVSLDNQRDEVACNLSSLQSVNRCQDDKDDDVITSPKSYEIEEASNNSESDSLKDSVIFITSPPRSSSPEILNEHNVRGEKFHALI